MKGTPPPDGTVRLSINLPAAIHAHLKERARREGVSMRYYLVRAYRHYVVNEGRLAMIDLEQMFRNEAPA